jgi:hypothetical protein
MTVDVIADAKMSMREEGERGKSSGWAKPGFGERKIKDKEDASRA